MQKSFFNSLPNFNSNGINVDRENSILKNTCIAQFGLNKNDSFFDKSFLNDLVRVGNESDGIKSRFGHPNMCSTSFGSFIGKYKNFSIGETTSGKKSVFADLHLDPITKKTQVEGKGISMYDYIMDMAETNPDMFGNSIHIYSECFEQEIDGEKQVLHKLDKFKACDLVDDPAATDSLFSANPADLGVIVTQFLDGNPQIFETISKQPAIIQDFFERYANYSNRKSLINFNMSFLDKMKKKFSNKKEGETFDIDLTLADGSIVTVVTDAEQPQVGDQVTDDAGSPVEDNEHVLPDGSSIVTVGGAITEIKEAAPADPAGEPTMADVMASVKLFGTQLTALSKNFNTAQKGNEAAFELLQDEFQKFEKSTNLKLKGIKSTYEAPAAEKGEKGGKKDGAYDADKVAEARKKLTEKK
jgi:hypothetical protein